MSMEIARIITQSLVDENEVEQALAQGSHRSLIEEAWDKLNARFNAGDIESLADSQAEYAAKFLAYWRGKFQIFMRAAGIRDQADVISSLNVPIEVGVEKARFKMQSDTLVMERESPEGVDEINLGISNSEYYGFSTNVGIRSQLGDVLPGRVRYIRPLDYHLQINNGEFYSFSKKENLQKGKAYTSRENHLALYSVRE